MRRSAGIRAIGCVALALSLAGCVRGCPSSRPPIHLNPNMDYQPKAQPQEESEFFYDGRELRLPVTGTVARGQLHADQAYHTGRGETGEFLASSPVPPSDELLERGERRFRIYCEPCHDRRGDGTGILFERGGVPTASFHDERVRGLPDGELFDVITQGKGLMPSYGYPIPAGDRWAIIAHVRRLQQERQASQVASAAGR